MRREGLAYGAGVLVTFVALAGVMLALRAAGEQLGWGFQLQSPVVVSALAVLFFVLALNLSGVFEFGQFAPSSVLSWASKNRTLDAFGTGVLAVVIASPCTAPFMGAALGFALSQPAIETIAVFVALGAGMALPYVLLAWFPAWRRALPKPGAWMLRFKQLLAFPLYATVAWLAWVLGSQLDVDAVLRLAIVLIAVAFALWAWHVSRMGSTRTPEAGRWGVFGVTVVAFFLAEMGDKTQVATVMLAAKFDALAAVVVGTTLGMLIANVPVVFAGKLAADRIPFKAIRIVAAAIFAAIGAWVLVAGVPG